MKKLKSSMKLVMGILLSVMFLTTVQAQQSPEAVAEKRAKNFKRSLNLSDEQTERVSQTFVTFFTKLQEIKKADLTQAERRKRNQENVKFREDSFKEILTPEQWGNLLEMRKKERERAKQRKAQQNQ